MQETKYDWNKKLKKGQKVKVVTRKFRRFTAIGGIVQGYKDGKLVIKGKDKKIYMRKEPQRIYLKEGMMSEISTAWEEMPSSDKVKILREMDLHPAGITNPEDAIKIPLKSWKPEEVYELGKYLVHRNLLESNDLSGHVSRAWKNAEEWMDQARDTLDDKDYLIRGAMKKFGLERPDAEKVFNKVMRDRDPYFGSNQIKEVKISKEQEKKAEELRNQGFHFLKFNGQNMVWVKNGHKIEISLSGSVLESNQIKESLSQQKRVAEKDVDPVELKVGIEVEREHTKDPEKLKRTALDHLAEDPHYYAKLKKAGLEVEGGPGSGIKGHETDPVAHLTKNKEIERPYGIKTWSQYGNAGKQAKQMGLEIIGFKKFINPKTDETYRVEDGRLVKDVKEQIRNIVREWMGGLVGIPNCNGLCDKCGMPENACECEHEEDLKRNEKAALPKGLKFMKENTEKKCSRKNCNNKGTIKSGNYWWCKQCYDKLSWKTEQQSNKVKSGDSIIVSFMDLTGSVKKSPIKVDVNKIADGKIHGKGSDGNDYSIYFGKGGWHTNVGKDQDVEVDLKKVGSNLNEGVMDMGECPRCGGAVLFDKYETEKRCERKLANGRICGALVKNKQNEVSPPGWSGTVKAMKKHKNITNPFALVWWMKKQGAKPHHKPEKT